MGCRERGGETPPQRFATLRPSFPDGKEAGKDGRKPVKDAKNRLHRSVGGFWRAAGMSICQMPDTTLQKYGNTAHPACQGKNHAAKRPVKPSRLYGPQRCDKIQDNGCGEAAKAQRGGPREQKKPRGAKRKKEARRADAPRGGSRRAQSPKGRPEGDPAPRARRRRRARSRARARASKPADARRASRKAARAASARESAKARRAAERQSRGARAEARPRRGASKSAATRGEQPGPRPRQRRRARRAGATERREKRRGRARSAQKAGRNRREHAAQRPGPQARTNLFCARHRRAGNRDGCRPSWAAGPGAAHAGASSAPAAPRSGVREHGRALYLIQGQYSVSDAWK